MDLHEMPYSQRIVDKGGVSVCFFNQWLQTISWKIYKICTIIMTSAAGWGPLGISRWQLLFHIHQRTLSTNHWGSSLQASVLQEPSPLLAKCPPQPGQVTRERYRSPDPHTGSTRPIRAEGEGNRHTQVIVVPTCTQVHKGLPASFLLNSCLALISLSSGLDSED